MTETIVNLMDSTDRRVSHKQSERRWTDFTLVYLSVSSFDRKIYAESEQNWAIIIPNMLFFWSGTSNEGMRQRDVKKDDEVAEILEESEVTQAPLLLSTLTAQIATEFTLWGNNIHECSNM